MLQHPPPTHRSVATPVLPTASVAFEVVIKKLVLVPKYVQFHFFVWLKTDHACTHAKNQNKIAEMRRPRKEVIIFLALERAAESCTPLSAPRNYRGL